MKIFESPSWVEKSRTASGDPVELNLSDELKPYIAFITSSTDTTIDGTRVSSAYGEGVNQLAWDPYGSEFKKTIPFTSHKKGFIFRNLTENERNNNSILVFPTEGNNPPSEAIPNLIIPKVKTYSQVADGVYEESYDSAKININTGDVEISSITSEPYLVIIY